MGDWDRMAIMASLGARLVGDDLDFPGEHGVLLVVMEVGSPDLVKEIGKMDFAVIVSESSPELQIWSLATLRSDRI
ncbi:hypothetical protein ACLOJK_021062 [Asimina triloba]